MFGTSVQTPDPNKFEWAELSVAVQGLRSDPRDTPAHEMTYIVQGRFSSQPQVNATLFAERVEDLVRRAAGAAFGSSMVIDIVVPGGGKSLLMEARVSKFAKGRPANPEEDGLTVYSVDHGITKNHIPGDMVWFTAPNEFRLRLSVRDVMALPDLWNVLAGKLGLS